MQRIASVMLISMSFIVVGVSSYALTPLFAGEMEKLVEECCVTTSV